MERKWSTFPFTKSEGTARRKKEEKLFINFQTTVNCIKILHETRKLHFQQITVNIQCKLFYLQIYFFYTINSEIILFSTQKSKIFIKKLCFRKKCLEVQLKEFFLLTEINLNDQNLLKWNISKQEAEKMFFQTSKVFSRNSELINPENKFFWSHQ